MTVYQSIHSAGVLEAFAPGFTHTSVTRRFGVMQRALGAWIEAERDLEHSGSWDPACDHWLRDAEAARAAVGAALDALCDTPAERLEDRPLLRIARLTRALALSEDGAEFAQLYARVTAPGALLRCPGRHPLALRVNLMLSFVGAATATWALNRAFTFSAQAAAARYTAWQQYWRYMAAMLGGAAVNYVVYAMTLLWSSAPWAPTMGVALGSIAGLAVNFISARKVAFRTRNPSSRP